MTQYVIDFGIDANLGIEAGAVYPLQEGLVKVTNTDTGQGEPQWFTKLRQKDTLGFRLWDITGESSGELDIVSFTAYLLSPSNATRLSNPLDSVDPIAFTREKIYQAASTVKSSVFETPQEGWLVGSNSSALAERFSIENQGRYLLRIEVVVVVPSRGRRTYVHDPEMIVGSSGIPPEPP